MGKLRRGSSEADIAREQASQRKEAKEAQILANQERDIVIAEKSKEQTTGAPKAKPAKPVDGA